MSEGLMSEGEDENGAFIQSLTDRAEELGTSLAVDITDLQMAAVEKKGVNPYPLWYVVYTWTCGRMKGVNHYQFRSKGLFPASSEIEMVAKDAREETASLIFDKGGLVYHEGDLQLHVTGWFRMSEEEE